MNSKSCFCALILMSIVAGITSAQPPGSWSGWFGGAYGSYVSGELNSNDPAHEESTGDYEDDGPLAGLFATYRFERATGWVYGLELDIPLYMKKGTAVDKVWFPDVVTYEADYRWGVLAGGQAGRSVGRALVYGYGLIGLTSVDGKTYNVDENDQLAMGYVQSSAATHLIWQLGLGADLSLSPTLLAGARLGLFTAAKADHTMAWNQPGPNEFGYSGILMRLHAIRRF